MENTQQDYAILARAGAALVEFQFLRRGAECVRTPDGSYAGDLWVETSLGRISVEVKTTRSSRAWFVHPRQKRSEFFVLVHLEDMVCYVLSRSEIDSLLLKRRREDGYFKIERSWLKKEWTDDWTKIGVGRASLMMMEKQFRGDNYVAEPTKHKSPVIRVWVNRDGTKSYGIKRNSGIHKTARAAESFAARVAELKAQGFLRSA